MSLRDRLQRAKARKANLGAKRSGEDSLVLGIAWYTRDQWELLTKLVPDRSALDDTYEEWKDGAEEAFASLTAGVLAPIRVWIEVEELQAWCSARGVPNTAEARSDYVTHLVRTREREA